MTTTRTRHRSIRDLRLFAAGAGCGVVAGAFLVSILVWHYGNVIGSRDASLRNPVHTPFAVHRWGGKDVDDVGGPVIESAPDTPLGTSGMTKVETVVPGAASIGPAPESAGELAVRDLALPVEGVTPDQLTPQFEDLRGARRHEAIDILAPRNTPVKAVEDGTIARLFHSKAGGITVYQFDPTGRFCYYYAHLERYAEGLREGDRVKKGQILAYVGTSGNAPQNTPHLHFAIFRLTSERRWWEGTPIDPYEVLH